VVVLEPQALRAAVIRGAMSVGGVVIRRPGLNDDVKA
jgi:hypothetical protein